MPYQNALFLANLKSLKDRRIKLSQSFFKKILSTDSCLHTLLPPERNNEILRNPLKYPIPYSRTVLICILLYIFFILLTAYCVFYVACFHCIPRPTAHFLHVYSSYFTNPASWLPHWNKRLSCNTSSRSSMFTDYRNMYWNCWICKLMRYMYRKKPKTTGATSGNLSFHNCHFF